MYITPSEKESTQTRHDPGREWISKVIQEQLDLEEAAFTGVKREIALKASGEHALLQKHRRRLVRQAKALLAEQAPL